MLEKSKQPQYTSNSFELLRIKYSTCCYAAALNGCARVRAQARRFNLVLSIEYSACLIPAAVIWRSCLQRS